MCVNLGVEVLAVELDVGIEVAIVLAGVVQIGELYLRIDGGVLAQEVKSVAATLDVGSDIVDVDGGNDLLNWERLGCGVDCVVFTLEVIAAASHQRAARLESHVDVATYLVGFVLYVALELHGLQVELLLNVFAQKFFLGKFHIVDIGVEGDVGIDFLRVGYVLDVAAHFCLYVAWNLKRAILYVNVARVALKGTFHLNWITARDSFGRACE